MTSIESIAVIGGGMAGATAAVSLRERGFGGRVLLVSAEGHLPYERPPLSKGYLAGSATDDDLLVYGASTYQDLEIDLHLGHRVERVRPGEAGIEFSDGTMFRADRVLLCTGSRPRALNVPGAAVHGIHYLHDLEDAWSLRETLGRGGPCVVVGGGFIGAEVASTLAEQGAQVTLVTGDCLPLERVLGHEASTWLLDRHRSHGVDVRTRGLVCAVRGRGRVEALELADGSILPADSVVVGIGSEPETRLVDGLGIATEDGILVDGFGRTAIKEVLAAGDIARFASKTYGKLLRVEHWQHAQMHATAVAAGALDGALSDDGGYDTVPWAWSEQYGDQWEILGVPGPGMDVTRRGLPVSDEGALWLFSLDGRVLGAIAVNRRREVRVLTRAMTKGPVLSDPAMSDATTDLSSLLSVTATTPSSSRR